MLILLALGGTGCQNVYIQPNDIQTIASPAARLVGKANIKVETGEIVSDRFPAKGFGVEDQTAFATHLKEELASSNAFLEIDLNNDAFRDYLINILFHKTVASGGGLEGVYLLDVNMQIYDHGQLSLERLYKVVTPQYPLWSFFVDTTIRATKARAANELHKRLMQDINGWLLNSSPKNILQ